MPDERQSESVPEKLQASQRHQTLTSEHSFKPEERNQRNQVTPTNVPRPQRAQLFIARKPTWTRIVQLGEIDTEAVEGDDPVVVRILH